MTLLISCQLTAAGATAAIVFGLWSMPQSNSDSSVIQVQNPFKWNNTGQSQICTKLATVLPDGFISHGHSVFRETLEHSFASQAREELPECITKPSTAREVSLILDTLRNTHITDYEVKFAVRSGGHYGVNRSRNDRRWHGTRCARQFAWFARCAWCSPNSAGC